MGVARYEAAQSSTSQPRAEPVDKIGHRFFVQRAAFKLELAGNERFHHWHRQADQVEAETGVKRVGKRFHPFAEQAGQQGGVAARSEEHTSELQSLMRISYAVFCLKKKKTNKQTQT